MQRSPTLLFFLLLLATTAFLAHAEEEDEEVLGHFEPPVEENVDVIVPCTINDNGFGGKTSQKSFSVMYYQEIEYKADDGEDDIETIVRDLELATVDMLLKAASIKCILPPSPSNRRLQGSTGKLAVGISANPDDEVLELECHELNTTSNDCVVVDSGFEVFYTGGQDDDGNKLEDDFRTVVQNALEHGDLNSANDQIVQVVVTESDSYTRDRDNNNGSEVPPDNDVSANDSMTTPIVVAALVGTALITAAALAYRRTRKAASASASNGGERIGGGQDTPPPPPPAEAVEP